MVSDRLNPESLWSWLEELRADPLTAESPVAIMAGPHIAASEWPRCIPDARPTHGLGTMLAYMPDLLELLDAIVRMSLRQLGHWTDWPGADAVPPPPAAARDRGTRSPPFRRGRPRAADAMPDAARPPDSAGLRACARRQQRLSLGRHDC